MAKLKITLIKSPIASKPNHRKNVEALGLNRMHKTVILDKNPCVEGMIFKIKHMVQVEEIEA